jgi:predicted nucleic acid-binding protein
MVGSRSRVTNGYVLDTSAILALTDREDGWEEVERILREARAGSCEVIACAISLTELYYITLRETGEDAASNLIGLVKSWPVTWAYPDEKAFLLAGRLKASGRLSLADALIAAVAKLRSAILVHKDPELAVLASQVRLISLPYKKKGP